MTLQELKELIKEVNNQENILCNKRMEIEKAQAELLMPIVNKIPWVINPFTGQGLYVERLSKEVKKEVMDIWSHWEHGSVMLSDEIELAEVDGSYYLRFFNKKDELNFIKSNPNIRANLENILTEKYARLLKEKSSIDREIEGIINEIKEIK